MGRRDPRDSAAGQTHEVSVLRSFLGVSPARELEAETPLFSVCCKMPAFCSTPRLTCGFAEN